MDYKVKDEVREMLRRPLGRLFSDNEISSTIFINTLRDAKFVISVGDRVTETINSLGRIPELQIVDGKEKRKERELPNVRFSSLIKARNPAGYITDEAIDAIKEAMKGLSKPVRLLIDGEEDLLAIPAVYFAPAGSNLYYGQPDEGIVLVKVDESAKRRSLKIMNEIGIYEI